MRCLVTQSCFIAAVPGQKPRHYRHSEVLDWLWEEPAEVRADGDYPTGVKPRPGYLQALADHEEPEKVALSETEGSRRINVAAAVAKLDPEDDDHWTSGGLPRVDVVIGFLGSDTTRDEIKAFVPEARRDA